MDILLSSIVLTEAKYLEGAPILKDNAI